MVTGISSFRISSKNGENILTENILTAHPVAANCDAEGLTTAFLCERRH